MQFQDDEFATLSGVRIVRIAVHPEYAKVRHTFPVVLWERTLMRVYIKMGYGTKALEMLDAFYSGRLLNLEEAKKETQAESYVQASKVAEV